MTRYAKRKLKYSLNENFNLLPYVEWDRFVTLTGAQAEWGLRYRIYNTHSSNDKTYLYYAPADRKQILQGHIYYLCDNIICKIKLFSMETFSWMNLMFAWHSSLHLSLSYYDTYPILIDCTNARFPRHHIIFVVKRLVNKSIYLKYTMYA